jgi:hypothetical protein
VLGALESPRVQEALRAGNDPHDTRRAGLLADIEAAPERRADARRDYAEGIIEREDWLASATAPSRPLRRRAASMTGCRGSATVMSDIAASERVRDAWESWNVSRRRAAIKAVWHGIVIKSVPPGTAHNPDGGTKDAAKRREWETAILRQRVEFDWRV